MIQLFLRGIPLDTPVNPTYISGFITASGIFLSILTVTLINNREVLETSLEVAISVDVTLFAFALFQIFNSALRNEPTVTDLTIIMSSLMAEASTVITIVRRLRIREKTAPVPHLLTEQ
jgi:hypothetical protein